MWIDGLKLYDEKIGINWKWQSMDGAITKAPLGGKSTGPNPTDRSKSGTKRSVLVDGQGIPLGITVDGANRHDMKMTKATLQNIVICRPQLSSSSTTTTTKNTPQQQHISVLTRVMTILRYTSYLKNMVIPCIFAREEGNTIMVTKRREEGYQNIEQEDG